MEHYLSIVPRPLEETCLTELLALGARQPKILPGAISFQGNTETLYRMNLRSRCAMRFLVVLDDFPCDNENDLYEHAKNIPWENWISTEHTFSIHAQGTTEALRNSIYVSQRIKDGLVDRFYEKQASRPSVDREQPNIAIYAQLYKKDDQPRCTISIDSSGEPLFQRGYRPYSMAAPIKENLAAAMLQIAELQCMSIDTPIVDPFCGSGTFLLESLMIKLNMAPGLYRSFAFQRWPNYDEDIFSTIKHQSFSQKLSAPAEIICYGSDRDPRMIQMAQSCADKLKFSPSIQFQTSHIKDVKCQTKDTGIVICNPPYGHRLEDQESLVPVYRELGNTLKRQFAGWKAYVYTANLHLGRQIGLHPQKRWTIYNGPLEGRLLMFDLYNSQT